jgi:hypothetical protein
VAAASFNPTILIGRRRLAPPAWPVTPRPNRLRRRALAGLPPGASQEAEGAASRDTLRLSIAIFKERKTTAGLLRAVRAQHGSRFSCLLTCRSLSRHRLAAKAWPPLTAASYHHACKRLLTHSAVLS